MRASQTEPGPRAGGKERREFRASATSQPCPRCQPSHSHQPLYKTMSDNIRSCAYMMSIRAYTVNRPVWWECLYQKCAYTVKMLYGENAYTVKMPTRWMCLHGGYTYTMKWCRCGYSRPYFIFDMRTGILPSHTCVPIQISWVVEPSHMLSGSDS